MLTTERIGGTAPPCELPAISPSRGEIIPPSEDVRVILAANPLKSSARKVMSVAPRGTVAEIIAIALAGEEQVADDFLVMLGRDMGDIGRGRRSDMTTVPHNLWPLVRPKAGTILIVRALPRFSALFGAITAAVSAVSSAIAGLGFFGKLLLAGISFAAKLLLNKLFAPKQPKQVESDAKPSYSITSSRNTVPDISTRLPFVLGKHRVTPYLGALPYTENSGREQFLRMLFVPCYGRVSITEIKIGETLASTFDDCTVETREGTSTVEATTLYPTNRQPLEEQLGVDLVDVIAQTRRTAEDITQFSVDLLCPNGLCVIKKEDGSRLTGAINVAWRYRKVGDASYTNLTTLQLRAATQDVIRRTLGPITVPVGQYDIQVQRLTPPSTSQQVVDDMQWTAIRGFRTGEPITFAKPVAAIAIRIRSSSQLNGALDTLNCVVQSKVRAWNGSTWVDNTLSRNPADLMRHVLQGPFNPAPYADAEIDLPALQAWRVYCGSNGWTYDKIVTERVSVWDLVSEICAAGRAMPVFKDGKYSVTWDEQASLPVQMFTPRNSFGFKATKVLQDLPHGYRCAFVNAAKGYRQDERLVFDDGYSKANATIYEAFEMPGCTSTDLIYKHARYHIAQTRLRTEQFELNVALEGITPTRNDKVYFQNDVPLIGLGSGRVLAVDSTPGAQKVTVDEILTMSGSDAYNLRFRLRDGAWLVRNVVPGTSGELQLIPLVGTSTLPQADDLFAFGPLEQEVSVCRVVLIEPLEDERFRFMLVDDAPGIYLADSGLVPDYDGGITEPVDPFELPPTDIRITDGAYEEDGQFYAYLNVSWSQTRSGQTARFEIEYRDESYGEYLPAPSVGPDVRNVSIRRLNPSLYTVRVRAIFSDGSFSAWLTSEVYAATRLLNPPADVENFRIATTGDNSTLSWSQVPLATYEIRFSPTTDPGVTWNTSSPLFLGLSGTSIQTATAIGTYLIKAVLPGGVQSSNATIIISSVAALTGRNVVEVLQQDPGWSGTRTDVDVADNELRLASNNTIDSWDHIDDVTGIDFGTGEAGTLGYAVSGTYEFGPLDLGAIYTSRLTAVLDAYGFSTANTIDRWPGIDQVLTIDGEDPGGWAVTLSYAASDDDPIADNWSAWRQLIQGDATFRSIKFMATLTGNSVTDDDGNTFANSTPSIIQLAATVDMPDEIRAGSDIAVGTGAMAVSFVPAFKALNSSGGVAIAAQDMATGDYYQITAKDETGFNIIFKNTAGAAVARTFDYVAKGYGRQN